MSKVEMMSAKDKKKGALVPRLRFPEFRDAGEWGIKLLGQISENLDNRRVPITENVRIRGAIPYYGASGIVDYVNDFIFDEELMCVSEDGANLIARTSPIAFSISGKSWINNHAHVLKFYFPSRQKLVENYINFIKINEFLTGMAQPKLNKAKLEVIPIPIPPTEEEEQKIADCLSSLDERITAESSNLDTLKDHKKGLLKQLFPAEGETLPQLRFPEFRDAGEWTKVQLSKIAIPISERVIDGDADAVLTLSAEHGVVAQGAYFGKKVAGDDVKRYIRIRNNDFVYNDRTTKTYKYGTIKRLSRHACGIVSPIYKCFRFNYEEIPVFWEWYFESGEHDAQLYSIINEGAKEGRFNISIQQFLSTHVYFPNKIEQKRIADCLSSLDELITAQTQKIDLLKTHKKGLMQQLFPVIDEAKA